MSPLAISPVAALAVSLGVSLAVALVVLGVTALVSRRVGRVAVVDVAWGLVFVAVALSSVVLALALDGAWWRSSVLAALVAAWGLRLAWHIRRRASGEGHGEDPRYAAVLGEDPWHRRPVAVLTRVFLVQAVAAWVVSAPLAVAAATSVAWWPLVWVGVAVGGVGLLFEAVGDAQLDAYKQQPRESRPPVMDRGLWRYTPVTPTTSATHACGGECGSAAPCRPGGCPACSPSSLPWR